MNFTRFELWFYGIGGSALIVFLILAHASQIGGSNG